MCGRPRPGTAPLIARTDPRVEDQTWSGLMAVTVRRLTTEPSVWRGAASRRGVAGSHDDTATDPSQRVLIIDDHAPFRAAARKLLERRGFTVVAEADGATAGFEAAQAFGPDAVVLDINLPDGNGIDVCRALRHASPALVVLLISADTANGRWAKECGAAAFLPKDRLASADLVALLRGDADEDLAGRATA
jgi:CheY-like chemotaxis protein